MHELKQENKKIMKERILLSCGCVASATDQHGNPSCPIHVGIKSNIHPIDKPNLDGRQASCGICHRTVNSSYDLAFFEYNGPGSPTATEICKGCRYYKCACKCNEFVPLGDSNDTYYCGCIGWD